MTMARVVIETPYAADNDAALQRNQRYLRAVLRDCLRRGESPYASHGLYTQPGVLDDRVPSERQTGIAAGLAWQEAASLCVVYIDLGVSAGMLLGMKEALRKGLRIDVRVLPEKIVSEILCDEDE